MRCIMVLLALAASALGQLKGLQPVDIDVAATLLDLDQSQRALFDELYAGYAAEFERRAAEVQDAAGAIQTGKTKIEPLRERVIAEQSLMWGLEKEQYRLMEQLFADLELILMDEQRESMVRVERLGRRREMLGWFRLAGRGADVVAALQEAELTHTTQIDDAILDYEVVLDRMLRRRAPLIDGYWALLTAGDLLTEEDQFIDLEQHPKGEGIARSLVKQELEIRSLTDRYAARIGAMLDPAQQAAFEDSIARQWMQGYWEPDRHVSFVTEIFEHLLRQEVGDDRERIEAQAESFRRAERTTQRAFAEAQINRTTSRYLARHGMADPSEADEAEAAYQTALTAVRDFESKTLAKLEAELDPALSEQARLKELFRAEDILLQRRAWRALRKTLDAEEAERR